jgi:hypothetical protein
MGGGKTMVFDSSDGMLQKNFVGFLNWACNTYGLPSFAISCTCDKKTIEARFKKANEAEEINEEQQAELDA